LFVCYKFTENVLDKFHDKFHETRRVASA